MLLNIKDLIGEATEYDKKLTLEQKKPKSWCKSVSAFANTIGGTLVFGISNDDEFVGVENPEQLGEIISETVKKRLQPIPQVILSYRRIEGKVFILLEVKPGEETPYYYDADGVVEAYVRVGNESVKADATELKHLVLRGKNTSWDTQLSPYKMSDYAYSKLRARYKKWTGNSFDDKDMVSFGLANEAGVLTNAGALIADDSPVRWSRLFCTRWNGLNKAGGAMDAIDDAEYEGSVLYLLDEGEAFIKRHAKMMWRKLPNSREELPEYVERSYHEALINALVHRDYLVNGSEVHIDIYDDRMEIYSPGGMADGVQIQDRDPLTVPSTRRNPLLADIFNRLGYMERKGSGFEKIINGYEFQVTFDESKKPSFYSDRTQFRVIMPNLNYGFDVDELDVKKDELDAKTNQSDVKVDVKDDNEVRKNRIIYLIRINPRMSQRMMAEESGIPFRTLQRIMKEMVDNNEIRRVGTSQKGHWEIIE